MKSIVNLGKVENVVDINIWQNGSGGRNGDNIDIQGNAFVSGDYTDQIFWTATVAMNALAATIQTAIKEAAVAAAALVGQEVGALDKKTLYGGPVGV
jgi:hypothetical protein